MPRFSGRGFTLTELLIAIIILGVTAAVVIPNFNYHNVKKLDVAANEVAYALRFARSEAIRTGSIHGIQISQTNQRVVAYKANMATDPVSMEFILTDPVSKKLLDFDFDNKSSTLGTKISNSLDPFDYAGLGRVNNLLFDGTGTPIWVVSSSNTTYLLTDGMVQLDFAGKQRVVTVAPHTARITIE